MKAILTDNFSTQCHKYSVSSVIKNIAGFAFRLFNNTEQNTESVPYFAIHYSPNYPNHASGSSAYLYQSALIDMAYEVIREDSQASDPIDCVSAVNLYDAYQFRDLNNHPDLKDHRVMLYVLASAGEQKNFQHPYMFLDEFAREKYILENDSQDIGFDYNATFEETTGMNTDYYTGILGCLWAQFTAGTPVLRLEDRDTYFNNIPADDVVKVLEDMTTTPEAVRKSSLKRQIFYSKPILKIDGEYVCVNPHLLCSWAAHSNYWIIRSKYQQEKSQTFVNGFGRCFERYVEELIRYCLCEDDYIRIPEMSSGKKADWKLTIGGYTMYVEQKSSLATLSIKQNRVDMAPIGDYMKRAWGEAIGQLNASAQKDGAVKPIKIILHYEHYFMGVVLHEYFTENPSPNNDGYTWLLGINEFERLLMTYKKEPENFDAVIKKKLEAEQAIRKVAYADSVEVDTLITNLTENNENEYLRLEKFSSFKDILFNILGEQDIN